MPRGLDSVPNSMVLLVGVMVESLLVLLATLFVLRRFHGEQTTTGGYQIPDSIIVQWSGDSGGPTEMATECMESARLSGAHKTDPSFLSRGWKSDPNHCTMTFEKQPNVTKFPKSTIHDNKSYVQPSAPLACKFTRASKSSKAASRLTFSMRSHQLDWVLFTVAFVANTIFLLVLYAFAFGWQMTIQSKRQDCILSLVLQSVPVFVCDTRTHARTHARTHTHTHLQTDKSWPKFLLAAGDR